MITFNAFLNSPTTGNNRDYRSLRVTLFGHHVVPCVYGVVAGTSTMSIIGCTWVIGKFVMTLNLCIIPVYGNFVWKTATISTSGGQLVSHLVATYWMTLEYCKHVESVVQKEEVCKCLDFGGTWLTYIIIYIQTLKF